VPTLSMIPVSKKTRTTHSLFSRSIP